MQACGSRHCLSTNVFESVGSTCDAWRGRYPDNDTDGLGDYRDYTGRSRLSVSGYEKEFDYLQISLGRHQALKAIGK